LAQSFLGRLTHRVSHPSSSPHPPLVNDEKRRKGGGVDDRKFAIYKWITRAKQLTDEVLYHYYRNRLSIADKTLRGGNFCNKRS